MNIRDPRKIRLNLMTDDTTIWNDEQAKRHCDDPLCNEKTHSNNKSKEMFGDKNNNGIPDYFEQKKFKGSKNNNTNKVNSMLGTKTKKKSPVNIKKWI